MSAARVLTEDLAPKVGFELLPNAQNGIIYGPFLNGPMGKNLGVNILGNAAKVCSFDCVYCDLGATTLRLNKLKDDLPFPAFAVVEKAISEAFQQIHTKGPVVDGICLSGNGEATLHPEFPEIVRAILTARDLWMPGKPVNLFTNGAALDTRKIADAANLLDHRIVKIDAGSEKLFKAVNAPLSRTNLARVLSGTRRLKDVIIQTLFFQGPITNTNPTDVDDWIEVIAMLKPKGVHLYGLSRKGAREDLIRCDEDTIYSIAARLERKTQIKAIVIP